MSLGSFSQIFREGVLTKLENKEFSRVPLVCKAWATHSEQLPVLMARYRDPSLTPNQQNKLLGKIFQKIRGSTNYHESLVGALFYTQQYMDVLFSIPVSVYEALISKEQPIHILRSFILEQNVERSYFEAVPEVHVAALQQLAFLLPKLKYLHALQSNVMNELDSIQNQFPLFHLWLNNEVYNAASHYSYAQALETSLFAPYRKFIEGANAEEKLHQYVYSPDATTRLSRLNLNRLRQQVKSFLNPALGLFYEKILAHPELTHPDVSFFMNLRQNRTLPNGGISLHGLLRETHAKLLKNYGVTSITKVINALKEDGESNYMEIPLEIAEKVFSACVPLDPEPDEPAAKKSRTL